MVDGSSVTIWDRTSDRDPAGVITRTASTRDTSLCASPFAVTATVSDPDCGGPLAVVRRLYRSGILRAAGQTTYDGRRVDVLTGAATIPSVRRPPAPSDTHIKVFVDATSFAPVIVQFSTEDSPTTTTIFADFRRLPLTATSRRLLALRPHPGARVR